MGFVDNAQPEIKARAKSLSPRKSFTAEYEVINLDSTAEGEDIEKSEDNRHCGGKRRRTSSHSDTSFEKGSRSASPEIGYAGTPVIYKVREVEGRLVVIKVPMSSRPKTRRSQKCTDQDISNLLDSDNEDLAIFDPIVELGERISGSPRITPKSAGPKRTNAQTKNKTLASRSKENSPSRAVAESTKPRDDEVSLKIKLRRSTEQSNYKIAIDSEDEKPRRKSTRLCAGTPKRCKLGDCDDDHETHSKNQRSTPKTPKRSNAMLRENVATPPSPRRTRRNSRTSDCSSEGGNLRSFHNKENESKANNDIDDDASSVDSFRSTRSKSQHATPQKQSQKSQVNVKKTPQKSVKKLNEAKTPRRGYLDEADVVEPLENNEESLGSRLRGTPQRQMRKIATPLSSRPRRSSVIRNYVDNDLLPDDEEPKKHENIVKSRGRPARRSSVETETPVTPQKHRKLIEEPTTPARTPRSSVLRQLEETTTPKRITRRSISEKLEEPRTPMRTPRKSIVDKFEEVSTPKKTPKRPATILEIDEPPATPTASRKNLKVATPSMKLGNLTPSMSRRTANVGKPKTILEEARSQLHVSTVPKSLPCRDDEFNDIFTFLQRKLLDKSSGCIYISGVPGTGKTATVTEAIRALRRCVGKGELENFDFIEINGMKLSEPRQAYVRILKQMDGQTATWEQAHGILDKRFTKSNAKRQMTLLLVDELDLLCNKRQDVVYNLLDWPSKQNSHLVVITIANTMDLPERVLMSRVTSRLGLTRLTFQPYNFKQLQEIVEARLKDSDAFRSEAIQLVARKVAAVSGDARRALDICRRATEITELKNEKIVSMAHVNEALQEMISSAKVKAIKLCSDMEKLFLRAVDAEVTRTGVEEVVFHNIYRQLTTICSFEGVKTPNITLALLICSRLSAYRLLLSEQTRNDLERRIILNVSSDDIHFAMQTFEVS